MAQNSPFFDGGSSDSNFNEVAQLSSVVECSNPPSESPTSVLLKTNRAAAASATSGPTSSSPSSSSTSSSNLSTSSSQIKNHAGKTMNSEIMKQQHVHHVHHHHPSHTNGNSIVFKNQQLALTCSTIAPTSPKKTYSYCATETRLLASRTSTCTEVTSAFQAKHPRNMEHLISSNPQHDTLDKIIKTHKKKLRCPQCQIRIPVTSITCRCGLTFCSQHRYAEEHNCTYDFKLMGKRKLEIDNPKILAAKIAKII